MSEWLIDEDPETLCATLSLVASWDIKDESELLSSSSSDESHARRDASPVHLACDSKSKTVEKTSVTRRRRTNSTREKRKEEIDLLCNESTKLTSQLLELQQRREEMLRPHFSGDSIKNTAPIWENLARRQFLSRRRSEKYNAKLRGQIADRVQAAEELMQVIQVAIQRQEICQKVRRPNQIDWSQLMSEEEQLKRLDHHFPRWQWAMALSPKIEQGELEFLDFSVGESDGFTATMDAYTSYALPHPLAFVGQVGWAMLQNSTGDNFGEAYKHEIKSGDSLIVSVFDSTCTMGGELPDGGTMYGRWVARRQLHDSYRIFVAHWHYELKDFHNELDGVSVEEVIWVRLVDARDVGHAQISSPLTVHQQVRRLEFNFNQRHSVPANRVERVMELFKKQIEDEVDAVRGLMESMLLAMS